MTESWGLFLGYYSYRVSTSLGFYLPISVIYVLDQGYGVAFIAFMQAVFSMTLLTAEIPSGYLGDRLGRRRTLAIGSAFQIIGLVGYVVVDTATGFLILKVLFGTGWAFRSGTEDAWLYDLLATFGDTNDFAQVEGRGSTIELMISAAGAVAGGFLYGFDPTLPFLANAALATLGLPVLASMPAVNRVDSSTEETLTVRAAVRTLRIQIGQPAVRWVVAYTILIFLVFDLTRTFEQPALEAVGVPVAGMGLLYAGFKLVSAGAASTVGWFKGQLGIRRTLALAVPILGLSYATLAVVPLAVVPVLFLYRGARTILRPVRNQYLNDRLAGVGRATVLSGISMILSFVGAIARLAAGEIAAVTGPVTFLAGAGVGLALMAGGLWVAVSPVRPSGKVVGTDRAADD